METDNPNANKTTEDDFLRDKVSLNHLTSLG